MTNTKKFFVVFVAIFVMVANVNAQTFIPDKNGKVNAITPEVRVLMDKVNTAIVETAPSCLAADKKMSLIEDKLKKASADQRTTSISLELLSVEYHSAISKTMLARRPVGEAFHKAAMAYFDNVNAILKSKAPLAKNDYAEWQDRVLSKTHSDFPPEYKSVMEKSEQAIKRASAREAEFDRKVQKEFEESQKRDKELRERISK